MSQLTALGFAVHEESFEYSAFPGRLATPVAGVLLACTLGASAVSALLGAGQVYVVVLLAGLAGAGLFVRRMLGDGVLDLPWMRQRGTNLVATRGSSAPAVWLVAHLDSKSQPVPSAVRVFGVAVLAGTVLLAVVGAVFTFAGGAPRALWWTVIVAGAIGAMPVIASVVGNHSDGAVDNASGVAAVLCAAARIRSGTSVGVLLPSAEELGLAGARAFARARSPGVALNCDGVDDDGVLVVMYNGSMPERIMSTLRTISSATGRSHRARRMPLGLLTDSSAFHDRGWQAVTVSHGSLTTLRRVHTPDDSLAKLRGTAIDRVADFLARSAEALSN